MRYEDWSYTNESQALDLKWGTFEERQATAQIIWEAAQRDARHGAWAGDVEAAFREYYGFPKDYDLSLIPYLCQKDFDLFKAGAEWGRAQSVPKEVERVVEAARAVSKCQVKNKKYMELLIAQDRAVLALERVEAGSREQEGGQ